MDPAAIRQTSCFESLVEPAWDNAERRKDLVRFPKLELSPEDRAELERRIQAPETGYRDRLRAQAVLLAARGLPNIEIERLIGLGREHVAEWRRRFTAEGIAGLRERPRPGRPPTFGPDVRQALVETISSSPHGSSRWTIHSLAEALAERLGISISRSQVRRILIELGLHRHQAKDGAKKKSWRSSAPVFDHFETS
jgi:transposase